MKNRAQKERELARRASQQVVLRDSIENNTFAFGASESVAYAPVEGGQLNFHIQAQRIDRNLFRHRACEQFIERVQRPFWHLHHRTMNSDPHRWGQ